MSILDDSSSTLTPCPTLMTNQHVFRTYQHDVSHETPDYEKFRPYFGWVNVDTAQKTMEESTQWGVSLPNTSMMKKQLKSRNPALNIPRRHEAVATDTVFSDTPAVDSGVKQAQVFVGRDTLVADACPMKSWKQFVNTLEDNIRRRGATDKLLSDSAKPEISNKVMDILMAYHISNWHSEPYHQNQSNAEWRYRTIKSWTNTVMNRSGPPTNCRLLCLIYVCYLLNYIACTALDGKIPLLALTGITPDISIILLFTFYQPVFYATYDQNFPSESEELIQFPPEMDENWVRYGLAKLGQISRLPNWQRTLFCAYTTQLLHSTGEVCWNNNDSYFIWFEFVCRNSGQIASRRSWKRSCLGLEYTSKCSRLALLWEPN